MAEARRHLERSRQSVLAGLGLKTKGRVQHSCLARGSSGKPCNFPGFTRLCHNIARLKVSQGKENVSPAYFHAYQCLVEASQCKLFNAYLFSKQVRKVKGYRMGS